MATVVKVYCTIHGSLTIPDTLITVILGREGTGVYIFPCTSCGFEWEREATEEVVSVLRQSNAKFYTAADIEREAIEQEAQKAQLEKVARDRGVPPNAPPINEDDLIDFGTLLNSVDKLTQYMEDN